MSEDICKILAKGFRDITEMTPKSCCPKCGGKTGLYQHQTDRMQMTYNWQGEIDNFGSPERYGVSETIFRCMDCGGKVLCDTSEKQLLYVRLVTDQPPEDKG